MSIATKHPDRQGSHLEELQETADETIVRLVPATWDELEAAREQYAKDAGLRTCPRCGGRHSGSHCQRPAGEGDYA